MRLAHSRGSGDGRKWPELREFEILKFVIGFQGLQEGTSENLPGTWWAKQWVLVPFTGRLGSLEEESACEEGECSLGVTPWV